MDINYFRDKIKSMPDDMECPFDHLDSGTPVLFCKASFERGNKPVLARDWIPTLNVPTSGYNFCIYHFVDVYLPEPNSEFAKFRNLMLKLGVPPSSIIDGDYKGKHLKHIMEISNIKERMLAVLDILSEKAN